MTGVGFASELAKLISADKFPQTNTKAGLAALRVFAGVAISLAGFSSARCTLGVVRFWGFAAVVS